MNPGQIDAGWPIVDYDWVYPFGAFLLASPLALVETSINSLKLWAIVTVFLNLAVLIALDKFGRPGRRASWFWVLFVGFTGGAAISQLESIVAPLVILGGLHFRNSGAQLTAVLTVGAWIKIFPGAIVASMFAWGSWATRRSLVQAAVVTSAALYGMAWLVGAGPRFFGFLSAQTDRGLQVESLWAQPMQLARAAGWTDQRPVANDETRTIEFSGAMPQMLSSIADVGLYIAVAAVLMLLIGTRRFRVARDLHHPSGEVIAGALVVTLVLIVMNKVGSPQFGLWYGCLIVLGIVFVRDRRMTVTIPLLALASTFFAQLVFPLFYVEYISGSWFGVGLGVARWTFVLAVLVVSCAIVVKPVRQ